MHALVTFHKGPFGQIGIQYAIWVSLSVDVSTRPPRRGSYSLMIFLNSQSKMLNIDVYRTTAGMKEENEQFVF